MEPPEKRKLEDSTQDGPGGATDKRPRVIGPSLPPRSETAQDSASNSEGSDSDSDDDDFGPSLPPPEGAGPAAAPESSGHGPSIPAPSGSGETDAAEPATSRRDDWMLQPPDDASWATRVDPTKLRNRKFQSGKPGSSRPAASGGGGVDASWTETPEQKMRRLQDEVLGVSSAGSGSGGSAAKKGEEMADSKRAQAMAERVEKFNEVRRKEKAAEGAARKEKKKEEDDDPSARAFDKEKDMSLGSKISAAQRRDMINKASDFGSRFSKGKYL